MSRATMRQILETLMAAARTTTGLAPGRCIPAAVLGPLLRRVSAGRPELRVGCSVPADLVMGVDAAVLERIAAPVGENAVRFATTHVWIDAGHQTGTVSIIVTDDGPGVMAEHVGRVFEFGWRAEPDDGHDGAGLGLALARRLATAAAGGIAVVPGDGGGQFVVDLPAAEFPGRRISAASRGTVVQAALRNTVLASDRERSPEPGPPDRCLRAGRDDGDPVRRMRPVGGLLPAR